MKLSLKYILPFVLVCALTACNEDLPDRSQDEGQPASLVLQVGLPELSISTKSIEFPSNPNTQPGETDTTLVTHPDKPSSWTPWQRAVDGQGMYCVSLLLIEKSTFNLVGYRNIYYYGDCDGDGEVTYPNEKGDIDYTPGNLNGWYRNGNILEGAENSTMAVASFAYDKPMHVYDGKTFEQLRSGKYRIDAIANWMPERGSNKSPVYGKLFTGHPEGVPKFDGLGGYLKETFQDIWNNIIKEFEETVKSGTPRPFTSYEKYDSFRNFILDLSVDALGMKNSYICPHRPMPITTVTDIELGPGNNYKTIRLSRVFARMRVTVVNNSNFPLTVHDLKFCDTFTKTKTYLFDNPDDPERCFKMANFPGATQGGPVATYPRLLRSFTEDTVIPGVPKDGSPSDNSMLLFDGYILENKDYDKPLTYTLDLEYQGHEKTTIEYAIPSTTAAITDLTDLRNSYSEDNYYAIWNRNNEQRYLLAGEDKIASSSEYRVNTMPAGSIVPESMMWQLERNGSAYQNRYYLKSLYGLYAGDPDASKVPLSLTKDTYFTFSNANSYLAMKSSASENYINVNGGNQDEVLGWYDNDAGSQFGLYKLEKQETVIPVAYNTPITLTKIDPVTSVVTNVNTINRNDFINIVVTVSYNEDTGIIEYEVKPWNEKSSDIEFN